jgi:hypothetical protein
MHMAFEVTGGWRRAKAAAEGGAPQVENTELTPAEQAAMDQGLARVASSKPGEFGWRTSLSK